MLKKLILAAALAALLLSFCSVFADQDGRNCWCNIDEYGCRITGEDSGEIYIMFWSEEARQYFMGTGSAPYDLVVEKPSQSGILALKCGIPSPVIIKTAGPDEKTQEPANECDGFKDCCVVCANSLSECIYHYQLEGDQQCNDAYETCYFKCADNFPSCINQ